MAYTDADKHKEAKHEVKMRKRVYPRLVQDGRMSFSDAERGIEIMEAIAADYEEPDLFGRNDEGQDT